MGADGIPERATVDGGAEIACLRTRRGWSRARLIAQLYREMDADDETPGMLSEAWLARLENGRMVKVPRTVIDALCRALHCTPHERARVLLAADRNILADAQVNQPDSVAEVLTLAMDHLAREARAAVIQLLGTRQVMQLSEAEILDMTVVALNLALANSKRSTPAATSVDQARAAHRKR